MDVHAESSRDGAPSLYARLEGCVMVRAQVEAARPIMTSCVPGACLARPSPRPGTCSMRARSTWPWTRAGIRPATFIEREALHAVPYGGVSDAEQAMLKSTAPLDPQEAVGLIDAVHQPEPVYIERITALLKGGKNPPGADRLGAAAPLDRVEAVCGLNGPESVSWGQAYIENCRPRAAGREARGGGHEAGQ